MSRPFYEIMGMIKAHYDNDDKVFNAYAGTIIDYYTKDGDLKGVEEIRAIMTGQREQRVDTPLYLNDSSLGKELSTIPVTTLVDESLSEIIERAEEKEVLIENTNSIKRHRRTKAEMDALRNETPIDGNENENENEIITQEKKRHRRTKQELEESGYYSEPLTTLKGRSFC